MEYWNAGMMEGWKNQRAEIRDQSLGALELNDHGERRRHPPSLKLWRTGRARSRPFFDSSMDSGQASRIFRICAQAT